MEFDVVSIRVILLLMMLGIAGVYDLKTRKIPDVLWLVFGGIGAILYIWDHHTVTPYHVIAILTSVFVGVAIWKWKIAGLADCFAILAMTVILPVHYEFVMIPIMIMVMAFFIVVFCMMVYNISLNLSEMMRIKKWIFSEFQSELKFKKAFAFLFIHRKRRHEKFIISAEKNSKIKSNSKAFAFSAFQKKATKENQTTQFNTGMYVQNIPPLITFLFGIAMFLLLPQFLTMIYLN